MELLILFAFLTGWFVCWIQMSKSESRKVQQLQFQIQQLELRNQRLESRIQKFQSKSRKEQQFAQKRAMALEWDLQ